MLLDQHLLASSVVVLSLTTTHYYRPLTLAAIYKFLSQIKATCLTQKGLLVSEKAPAFSACTDIISEITTLYKVFANKTLA